MDETPLCKILIGKMMRNHDKPEDLGIVSFQTMLDEFASGVA
jgi:hypothetical protein